MHRDRFWFGMAMTIAPVLLLLLMITPSIEENASGPIEGHVSFHGRPLAWGTIIFVPKDARNVGWAVGSIDESGHYQIGSEWHREVLRGKSGFRICVMPDYREITGGISQGPDRARTGGTRSGTKAAGYANMSVASGFPRQLTDPQTTRLEVRLDSGPAQVDIAL
jgi:hypothetical protein